MAQSKSSAMNSSAGPRAGGAFMKPLHPSKELAAVVGAEPLARSEAVSRMWAYIKAHKLQNESN
jgi:chromatin remodeling complex protein RSC6